MWDLQIKKDLIHTEIIRWSYLVCQLKNKKLGRMLFMAVWLKQHVVLEKKRRLDVQHNGCQQQRWCLYLKKGTHSGIHCQLAVYICQKHHIFHQSRKMNKKEKSSQNDKILAVKFACAAPIGPTFFNKKDIPLVRDHADCDVEIVRRKCDSLEAQLDDLQSYMHQIKEMIESKTLIETHQLANIDDIIRVLPQATIDIKSNNNNVNKHDQSVDGDPENIRKISNVEEKLNRVIDVLSDTYQQRNGGRQDIARFQNKNRSQYEFFQTAYNDVPQRPLYYESDSPYSSLNYKDHRYIKRPRQYYDDRRLYYEQRPQQYGDSEKSETLSDFEEFQRFKEFQKVQQKKEQISDLELKSRTTAASPPSYDRRNDNFERLDFNLLGRNEQQFNTFPSTKNNKKNNGQKPHTSDANSIDGRQSRCRNRQPRVDDASDESDRKFLKGNLYGRRSNSIQNDADRNILTEKMHRKPNGVASDASSEFTRRNSHRSQDNYSSSEDCIAKENETETDFVKERSNSISRSISSISQSRDRSSSLSQSKEEQSNGDKRRRPSLRKENSLKNGKRKNRRDSSGSDHPVQAVQRKSLHSLLKKYGLDPEKFELQVEEANGEKSQSSREPSDEADRAETEEFALELENTNVKSDGGPQINRESAVYDEQEQQPSNSIYFRDQENDYLEDQNISKFHQKDDAHPFHSDDNENVNDSDENLIALNQRVSDDLSEQADIINETEVSEFNNDDEKRENSIAERTTLNDIPNPEDENNNFRNEDSQLLLDDRKPVVKINAKTRRTTWTLQKLGSHLKDTTL